jgi:hypothetical protein
MQYEPPVEHQAAIYVLFALTVLPDDRHDVPQLLEKYDGWISHSFYGTALRLCLFAFVGKEDRQARWMG